MFYASQVANIDGIWLKKLVFDEYGGLEAVVKDQEMAGDSPSTYNPRPKSLNTSKTPSQWLLAFHRVSTVIKYRGMISNIGSGLGFEFKMSQNTIFVRL
jgi:hypothetical protein